MSTNTKQTSTKHKAKKTSSIYAIVAALLMLLVFLVAAYFVIHFLLSFGKVSTEGMTEANTEVAAIQQQLDQYYSANGEYPTREEYTQMFAVGEATENSVTDNKYIYSPEGTKPQRFDEPRVPLCQYVITYQKDSFFGESGDETTLNTWSEDRCSQ